MDKQLLTARDVADALGHKTTGHVYALIRAGKLPAVKVGTRGVRIPRQAFDDYLAVLNASARGALTASSCAELWASLLATRPTLAEALAPSAETLARQESEQRGFFIGLRNAAPRY